MAIQRMDNVGIVVDDIKAAIEFFTELGLELEGEAQVEGQFVDRCVGLDGVCCDIAMMRTPDGHGAIELAKYLNPTVLDIDQKNTPHNTLGMHRVMFAVDDINDVIARLGPLGGEVVGEVARIRGQLSPVLRPRPRRHLHRSRPATQLNSQTTDSAIRTTLLATSRPTLYPAAELASTRSSVDCTIWSTWPSGSPSLEPIQSGLPVAADVEICATSVIAG